MEIKRDAVHLEGEQFHTVSVEQEDDGEFYVAASNNEIQFARTVGSVSLADEGVGLADGDVRLDAASKMMELEYVDYSDEYGYDEIEINFTEKDLSG